MSKPATRLPLAGRRIAITRPQEQAAALAERLAALGAQTVQLATIAIAPIADHAPLDAAINVLAGYDWLVFTSVNGVAAFAERLAATGRDWSARGLARVAAIGPATARALEECGVMVDLMPEEYVAEAILDGLGNVAGQRLLLARADIARRALAGDLRLRGADVDEVAAYRTVIQPAAQDAIRAALDGPERVDAITFTSSSTARGLLDGLAALDRDPRDALAGVALAAIGPVTAATLREAGLEPALVAQEYTIPGLVAALAEYFTARDNAGGHDATGSPSDGAPARGAS